MSSFYFLLDSLMDMAVFLVLIIFLTATLRPRGGKWYMHLPLISLYVIQALLYVMLYKNGNTAYPPSVIDLFSWALRMTAVCLFYDGSKLQNLATYSLYISMNTFSRLFVGQLLRLSGAQYNVAAVYQSQHLYKYIAVVIALAVVTALLLYFCKKYLLRYFKYPELSRAATLVCTLISTCYFILIPILISLSSSLSPEIASALFILLLVTLSAVIAASYMAAYENSRRRQVLDQNAILQNQLSLQYQHFLEMERADNELHKLRHDIANHMLILKDMLNDGVGAPEEYVQRLTERYDSATTGMICRNFIFNAVLCRQREICEQNGVEFQFQIDVPASLDIGDIDVMGVLSNMLINAVNASIEVPENRRRYVYISARLAANVLAIAIENSCLPTTKKSLSPGEEPISKGWGLKIIKEAVEKYDGMFKFSIINDKAFTSATMTNKKL